MPGSPILPKAKPNPERFQIQTHDPFTGSKSRPQNPLKEPKSRPGCQKGSEKAENDGICGRTAHRSTFLLPYSGWNLRILVQYEFWRSDRQTDIRTQATYHPHGRVFLMCYSQSYESNFCTTNFSYVWKILVNLKPNFSKNIVSLVHRGAYCAFLVHKYPMYRCSGV